MAFLQANIYSNVLHMDIMIDVILPQKTEKNLWHTMDSEEEDIAVLYLLHGMGGNQSFWPRYTSIERYVSDYQMAVIMPNAGATWYTDTEYDLKYWQFISEELPEICHELFPQLSTEPKKTFAAGASMGGYGAIKLGLSKPEKFAAVASLSGAVAVAESMDSLIETPLLKIRSKEYWEGIFGPLDKLAGSENDLIHLVDNLTDDKIPRFYLVCGTEDQLFPTSEYLALKFREKNIPITFEKGPGKHDWAFWDQWIPRVITWLVSE